MAKMGRPNTYTAEIADEICRRIALGEPLVQICRDEHMPAYMTVLHWRADKAYFQKMYARAREDQADTLVDEILEVARSKLGDDEMGKVDSGKVQEKRLLVDSLKWRAAKLGPKTYGDKQTVEHQGTLSICDVINEAAKPPAPKE